MGYITSRTPCVTFVPGNSASLNFVIIAPGPTCSSEIGMKGGMQLLYMNDDCFGDGLITPVQKLLNTVAFIPEHTRRLHPILSTRNHSEPSPTEPLSLIDQVTLSVFSSLHICISSTHFKTSQHVLCLT